MAISKTAKASMVKEVKKVEVETAAEAIRKIRNDLAGNLYIPGHRIQALLNAYDEAVKASKLYLEADILSRAIESGKSYRVTRIQDEISVEELKPEDIYASFATELKDGLVSPFDREAAKHAVLGAAYTPTIRQVMEEEEQNAEPTSH